MTAHIISGKELAKKIRHNIQKQVEQLDQPPGLATVLVGDDPASHIYVRFKARACKKVGMYSRQINLPTTTTQQELQQTVNDLNNDPQIHGILVQLPLPDHLDEKPILESINPAKDVDGFHPINMGRLLAHKKGSLDNLLLPCTPKGVIKLIASTGLDLAGKKVVVIGRSNLVGKPVALMALYANATVTLCHSRTADLLQETSQADVLISAVGSPRLVTADMIKEGAVVIDVGTNRTDDGVVGDVDFETCSKKAGWITPVPGGVGPMTIACLLENTLMASQQLNEK